MACFSSGTRQASRRSADWTTIDAGPSSTIGPARLLLLDRGLLGGLLGRPLGRLLGPLGPLAEALEPDELRPAAAEADAEHPDPVADLERFRLLGQPLRHGAGQHRVADAVLDRDRAGGDLHDRAGDLQRPPLAAAAVVGLRRRAATSATAHVNRIFRMSASFLDNT